MAWNDPATGAPAARASDWPLRLDAALIAWRERPFAWGSTDCAGFVCHVIEAMTGVDLHDAVRGRYSDGTTACRIIRDLVGGEALTVEDAAAFYLGEPLATPLLAQRGDVVSIETAEGPALGICTGRHVMLAAPTGLAAFPMKSWRHAWRV